MTQRIAPWRDSIPQRFSAGLAAALRSAILVCVVTALGGCGFYLKGNRPLPEGMGDVNVEFDNRYAVEPPPLIKALKRRLRSRDDVDEDSAIKSRLVIKELLLERAVLSVSPLDGTAAEYELLTEVRFDFWHKGDVVLANDEVSARRVFSQDNTERLAAEAEAEDLVRAMHEDLADLIMLKIENELQLKVRYRRAQAQAEAEAKAGAEAEAGAQPEG